MDAEAMKKIREEYDAVTSAMRLLEKQRTLLLMRTVPASEGDRIEYNVTVGAKAFSRKREKREGIVQSVHLHHVPVSSLPIDEKTEPFWSMRVLRVTSGNELSRLADSVMPADFISLKAQPELDF